MALWKPKIDSRAGTASPLGVAISEGDAATIAMVNDAVRSRRMRLAYQPVVLSRDTKRIAFHEGLIRVMEPNGRIIPARDFIGAVEGHKLGREIDCLALDHGLATLARFADLRISINMSVRTIGYAKWHAVLKRGLALTPTVGERLILEITERSAMHHPDLVLDFMDQMHCNGISFALDDFGAGYTAIRFFKDFNFDILKIDSQFTRKIHRDPDNQALTKAMLAIGRQFEMFTVAEGVETPEEAECLQALGVDCQQGYLFGAPTTKPAWVRDSLAHSA